jgi:hypothetical protein
MAWFHEFVEPSYRTASPGFEMMESIGYTENRLSGVTTASCLPYGDF